MIHILKFGKTINFVEFDYTELRTMLTEKGVCYDSKDVSAEDTWMWDHRYMFLTFRSFHTIDEAMEFINNTPSIQDEIRDEHLIISKL